mgnify:CR=1 FL=1
MNILWPVLKSRLYLPMYRFNETVDIAVNAYDNLPDKRNFTLQLLKNLLLAAVKDILFVFNNNLMQQFEGVAMGNPLGPTLANILLSHYESVWLADCPATFKPAFYRRYVDDTFLLFRSREHVEPFL